MLKRRKRRSSCDLEVCCLWGSISCNTGKKLTFFGSQVKVPDDEAYDKAYDGDITIQWHKSVGPLPAGGEVGCEGACFTITQLTRLSSLSLSSFSSSPSSSSLLSSLLSVSLVIVDGKQVRSWGLHVHCK